MKPMDLLLPPNVLCCSEGEVEIIERTIGLGWVKVVVKVVTDQKLLV